MFRRIDTLAALGALGLHAIVAWVLVSVPVKKGHTSSRVEVEIVQTPKPPEPVLTPPKPPEPPPEPPKPIPKLKNAPAPVQSSAPPSPEPPPKTPPPPTFNLDPADTASANDVAVRAGTNNPGGDPNSKAPPGTPKPSGTGTAGAPNVYSPKSDVYIKTLPEIDGEACARTVSYPSEAEQLGIEGEVKLKVELDETGKVHDIKLLSGLGHGLDQAAMNALRHKCHFKPAIGTDGKPAAYVIQAYTWTFELPR